MHRLACCSVLCAAILAGCARSEDRTATDTAAAALDTAARTTPPTTPAAPTAISLADVAGTWNVRMMPENRDTTLATYVLNATSSTTGWTFSVPGRQPTPVRVIQVAGDSIVTETGPAESITRKGVQVTTRTVARLQGGRLVGISSARYAGSDSTVRLRMEGTRAP